jgi:hypothetical protein
VHIQPWLDVTTGKRRVSNRGEAAPGQLLKANSHAEFGDRAIKSAQSYEITGLEFWALRVIN